MTIKSARFVLAIFLLIVTSICVPAAANDKAPVFVDCPGNVNACMFDSVFVQVKAVHPNSDQAKSIRYFLVDGVGEVDPVTGIWSYFSEEMEHAFEERTIEIGASIGQSPNETYAEDNCKFRIQLGFIGRPYISLNGARINTAFHAPAGQLTEVTVSVFNPLDCDYKIWIDSIVPAPSGPLGLRDDTVLYFIPEYADRENRFFVTISSGTQSKEASRTLVFDTRDPIPSPQFTVCPEDTITVQQCQSTIVPLEARDPLFDDNFGVQYELVEGPGMVDSRGWRISLRNPQELDPVFDVEIRASYAGVSSTETDNCRFTVKINDNLVPDFSRFGDNFCGDTVEVSAEIDSVFTLRAAESDLCGLLDIDLESITPQPAGEFTARPWPNSGSIGLHYRFSPLDADKVFTVRATASTLFERSECEFYIKVNEFEPIAVMIGQVSRAIQGQHIKVPIILKGSPVEFRSFNFLIAYDATALSFQFAEEGSGFYNEGCEWEYFTYRYGADGNCTPDCPSGLLRVIGISDTNDGPNSHPKCLLPEEFPAEFAKLDFLVGNDRTFECRTIPLRFFWFECSDNSMDGLGYERYISRRVLDSCHNDISNPLAGVYPSYQGAQDIDCYEQPERENLRWTDFYNGYVKIACADSINPIGDLNLNEIELELADFQLLVDYMIYGDTVFHINTDGQLAAADIDRDGTSGTMADVTTMLTYMNGTRIPCMDLTPLDDTLRLNSSDSTLNIAFDSDQSIGGIYLTFSGNIEPTLLQSNLTLRYYYDASKSQTKVLVYSMDLKPILPGPILSDVNGHAILTASAGSTTGRDIPVAFTRVNLIKVRIEELHDVIQGQIEEVSIMLDQAPVELGGFDFQIKYDPSALLINEVLAGSAIDDSACGWKYFGHELESPGVLRIAGLAAVNGNPICFTPDEFPAELARIRILITNDRTYQCTYEPIQFYWPECGSNSLVDIYYDTNYISNRVFDAGYDPPWTDITDPTLGYPTLTGAQDSVCSDDSAHSRIRRIDFYNGGLDIVCADSIDSRWCRPGDLNMNDYLDIADAVVYANYFVYGLGVFHISPDCQIAASDINADGIPLTLEDLTYLVAVLSGRSIPYPKFPSPDTAFLNYYDGKLDLNYISEDSLGAMLVVVADSVKPTLDAANVEFLYTYNGDETRILIYSMSINPILSGPILSSLEGHDILEVSAATIDGKKVYTSLTQSPPISFRIGTLSDPEPDSVYTLPIYLDQASGEIGGFDLLLRYDSSALGVNDVLRGGDLYDISGCNWQYFSYQIEQPGILRITGIARAANDPICYTPYTLPAEIAKIGFKSVNGRTFECQFVPIRFYWEDCSDNVVADRYGDSLFISSHVFDVVAPDLPIQNPFDGYPSYRGAQNEDCYNDANRRPYRRVEFTNGGIHNDCTGPIDTRGDINLNELTFEIEDADLFADYLVYGAEVFTKNYEAQLRGTDANRDETTATLEDFTYLLSVTNKNYLPLPIAPSKDTLYYGTVKNGQLSVQFSSENEIGALFVTIQDSVEPRTSLDDFALLFHYDGTVTKALLYSLDMKLIPPGVILTNLRKNQILSVEAASTMGHKINTSTGSVKLLPAADELLPTKYEVYQNYPNPFNPSTTVRFDLPEPATVSFKVFNILGKTVYDYKQDYPAGQNEIKWSGKANDGNFVASGVYYYRIEAGNFSQTRKMILLK